MVQCLQHGSDPCRPVKIHSALRCIYRWKKMWMNALVLMRSIPRSHVVWKSLVELCLLFIQVGVLETRPSDKLGSFFCFGPFWAFSVRLSNFRLAVWSELRGTPCKINISREVLIRTETKREHIESIDGQGQLATWNNLNNIVACRHWNDGMCLGHVDMEVFFCKIGWCAEELQLKPKFGYKKAECLCCGWCFPSLALMLQA